MTDLTTTIHPQVSEARPSSSSLRGLDWLNFFIADVRTGVGPFVAVYLTASHWSLSTIGVALTVAEVAGVVTQAPGGALIDRIRAKRLFMAFAVAVLAASAVLMAKFPTVPVVYAAQCALGVTGSIFGPGISSITLGLVGYACLGKRTGRNGAFGSAGNLIAALSMGLLGYVYGTRAIFYFVAILSIPTSLTLLLIRGDEIDYNRARGAASNLSDTAGKLSGLRLVFSDRRLLIFAVLTILFHLGNGAMLALAGEMMTKNSPRKSDLWMGGLVIVPQLIMALTAPLIGRIADEKGRKPILLFGFLFLPLRCLLFSFVRDPGWLIGLQVLDGIAAGVFGIVGVLMIADCTEGTGHYNLALGTIGAAVGVGASISTTMAGIVSQDFGFAAGFLALGACGLAAAIVLWLWMPETRPGVAEKRNFSRPQLIEG